MSALARRKPTYRCWGDGRSCPSHIRQCPRARVWAEDPAACPLGRNISGAAAGVSTGQRKVGGCEQMKKADATHATLLFPIGASLVISCDGARDGTSRFQQSVVFWKVSFFILFLVILNSFLCRAPELNTVLEVFNFRFLFASKTIASFVPKS